jgi:hypothetical protein
MSRELILSLNRAVDSTELGVVPNPHMLLMLVFLLGLKRFRQPRDKEHS